MNIWEEKFEGVSFTDKVMICFKDGTELMLKHLYFDDSALEEIDWETVEAVYEV